MNALSSTAYISYAHRDHLQAKMMMMMMMMMTTNQNVPIQATPTRATAWAMENTHTLQVNIFQHMDTQYVYLM
jgi:hypothetical protein